METPKTCKFCEYCTHLVGDNSCSVYKKCMYWRAWFKTEWEAIQKAVKAKNKK